MNIVHFFGLSKIETCSTFVLCKLNILDTRGAVKVGPSNFGITKRGTFSTNALSRFASVVLDGAPGPPRLMRHILRYPCISVVPEATHKASQGPLKGAVSAEKALQGSETETGELLGGRKEIIVFPTRGN